MPLYRYKDACVTCTELVSARLKKHLDRLDVKMTRQAMTIESLENDLQALCERAATFGDGYRTRRMAEEIMKKRGYRDA